MNKNKQVLFGVIAAVAVICVVVALVINRGGEEKDQGVIKIGAILPLSGNTAVIGEPKRRALEIAFEELNGTNGINFEILFQDSMGSPRDGVAAFQKMLNNRDIRYFYIDLTPIVNSSIPLIKQNKVITFAGSAEPEITDQSDYLFRLFAGGDQEIQLMVESLRQDSIDGIFVLHTDDLYGINAYRYLEKEFLQQGGKILGHENYPMNNMDFRSALLKAQSVNPQKIILLGYGNEYASLFRQAIELSIQPDMFFCNVGGSNKAVIELSRDLTEGMSFVSPRFTYLMMNNTLEPEMEYFVDQYRKKYDELPDFRSAYVYDTIKILHFVWSGHKDHVKVDSVRTLIKQVKDFKGASGTITFLENGDALTDLVVAQFVDGKIVIKPENYE